MEGTETRRDFQYKDVLLPKTNAIITGTVATVQGVLYGTTGYVTAKVDDETTMRFKLYQRNSPDPAHNVTLGEFSSVVVGVDGWPLGMDVMAIINEFMAFVAEDIAKTEVKNVE